MSNDCTPIINVNKPLVIVRIIQPENIITTPTEEKVSVVVNECVSSVVTVQEDIAVVTQPVEVISHVVISESCVQVVMPCNITINEAEGGGDGESVICEFIAGAALNVNRVVYMQTDGTIAHADKDDAAAVCDVVGVTKQSGTIGQLVEVVKFGKLTGANLGTPGDNFWLGSNGTLVTSPATTGAWLYIGTQLAGNNLLVKIGEPTTRA